MLENIGQKKKSKNVGTVMRQYHRMLNYEKFNVEFC